ncbi:SNARE domain protein [Necator americanus]|uniref:SNARE domain protein n=1 Tax=Necator americanus TaxID=51031 RepID=W2T8X2_NECAM|nr:SNARE domain protein [Necator americanus]ETN78069.1 SNARE domain protein [Necator americanus]
MEVRSRKEPAMGMTRNLTEVFTLLRTNAQQNKFIYMNSSMPSTNRSKDIAEEKMSLVSLEEGGEHSEDSSKQPIWIHTCDEVEFEFGRVRSRLEELATAQQKHISRPNFGDEAFEAEERQMESTTEQITSMMSHCQRLINMISSQSSRNENTSERKLRENTVSALIFTLSQLTNDFRTRQSKYLKDIKNRTSNVDSFLLTTGQSNDLQWGELVDVTPSHEYTMDQIQQMMMNEQTVKEREKEVLVVNSSIRELNSLFKDLSSMVVDQGTILDRIDYNVEQASIRVSRAVDSVKKAEKHQRGDKKMHCIFCQTVAIIVILLLIVLTKL